MSTPRPILKCAHCAYQTRVSTTGSGHERLLAHVRKQHPEAYAELRRQQAEWERDQAPSLEQDW